VILWVYYSAQIFFLGAELTHEVAKSHGSRSGAAPVEAANTVFPGDASLVRRAQRIVGGRDPLVAKAALLVRAPDAERRGAQAPRRRLASRLGRRRRAEHGRGARFLHPLSRSPRCCSS
jgi:hypothetical protein